MRLPFFYGWVVVAVAFVTMGVGVSARTAFSLLFPPILDEFHWERGLTAGAFSLGFIISALFAPLIGVLMDRKGPRWTLNLGVILVGSGMALAPLVTRPWHLYLTLGVLVSGGSLALAYTGHALFLPNWFVRRRGLATGIAFSGVGIGSMVIFPWMQDLIVGGGWRRACLAVAVVVFALFPLNLLQRRRPEDIGLLPDGDTASHAAAGAGPAHPANVVDPVWASVEWTLPRAVRTARFWWLAVSFFAGLYGWYAVQVHQTRYLLDVGFAPATAALALGLVPFMGIAGQIALGHLSDRLGRETGWTIGAVGFAACYLLLLVMGEHPTPAVLYAMVIAQGLLGYGVASVFAAIPAEVFGKGYATIFGTLNVAAVTGGGVGPWVTGAIYDHTGSYVLAWWIAIGCCVVSVACMWLAAPRKVRAVAGRVRPREHD